MLRSPLLLAMFTVHCIAVGFCAAHVLRGNLPEPLRMKWAIATCAWVALGIVTGSVMFA